MLRRRNHMHAAAQLRGSAHYPRIRGIVEFTQMEHGVNDNGSSNYFFKGKSVCKDGHVGMAIIS